MTTYTINLTNGSLLTTISPQTENTSSTPITLFGQGVLNYGQLFNDNYVHMIEHFANSTAPANPLVGTLWYNSAFSIYQVWNGTTWVALRPDVVFPNDAGITTALISTAPSIVGVFSNGNIIATFSDIAVSNASLPPNISFRNNNYAFASRFPYGIGTGISISSDTELNPSDNSDTLVTSRWVKLQGYASSFDSATIITALGYTPLNPANNLSELVSKPTARTNLGLGTISVQSASAVAITGGTIDGTILGSISPSSATFTTIALTGSQTAKFVLVAPNASAGAPTWRQLLFSDISGLGTMSAQSASAVAITGGTIDGTVIGGSTPNTGTFTTVESGDYNVQSEQVVGPRQTGWTAPVGTVSRASLNTSAATTTIIAQTLAALINDLLTHGLIGTSPITSAVIARPKAIFQVYEGATLAIAATTNRPNAVFNVAQGALASISRPKAAFVLIEQVTMAVSATTNPPIALVEIGPTLYVAAATNPPIASVVVNVANNLDVVATTNKPIAAIIMKSGNTLAVSATTNRPTAFFGMHA